MGSTTTKKLILWLLIFSFTNQLRGIAIEGEILNFDQSEIAINLLFGRFPMKSDELKIPLTKTGKFSVNMEIEEVRYAELKIGEHQLQLFLSPKATPIKISADYLDFKNTLTFQGGNSIENTFLHERSHPNYHQKFNALSKDEQRDAEKIDEYFESEELKELEQLRTIKNTISQAHYQILAEEIRNYYLILRLKGGLEIGYQDLAAYEKKWMSRNDKLVRQINCEPLNKYGPYFNHLLGSYYSHLERKLQITLMKDSVNWIAQFELGSLKDIIKELERDYTNKPFYVLTKDEMCEGILEKALSNKIYRSQEDGDYENLVYLYEEFEKRFPRSKFLERLEPRMAKYKKFAETGDDKGNGISFYPIKNSLKNIDELLNREEFKNKVVLVDIWGTWCGPCREEFKYLKGLKLKLKGEEVVFLYIADEKRSNPENQWKEAARFFELEGYHYLLTPEVSKDLWEKVDPNSNMRIYPTYMIINRNKEVAIPRAHLPSEGDKLYDQIKTILAEK